MLLLLAALNNRIRKFQLKRYGSAIQVANRRAEALRSERSSNRKLKAKLARSTQMAEEEAKARAEQQISTVRQRVKGSSAVRFYRQRMPGDVDDLEGRGEL